MWRVSFPRKDQATPTSRRIAGHFGFPPFAPSPALLAATLISSNWHRPALPQTFPKIISCFDLILLTPFFDPFFFVIDAHRATLQGGEVAGDGPAAAQGDSVGTEVRAFADPAGSADLIDEGDADGEVWLAIGDAGDLRVGAVCHAKPGFLHLDGVEMTGLDFRETARIEVGEAEHHFQQEQRAVADVLAAGGPDDGFEGENAPKFKYIDVIAGLGTGGESECLVDRHVEEMQPPAQDGIVLDGEETPGRIVSPVELDLVIGAADDGFAERIALFPDPAAINPLDLESGCFKRCDVHLAVTGEIFDGIVKKIEVV